MRRAGRDHADHAPCRAGQDGVLAAEGAGLGQPAVRLHELKASAPCQSARDLVDVAAEDRREVGVDHGGIAPPDQLDQRRYLMTDRDLGKAKLAGNGGQTFFMVGEAPAVHQYDRQRLAASRSDDLQVGARALFVEPADDRSIRPDPLVDLDHILVEHRGQGDVPSEYLGTGLIADPQGVAEALRDGERQPFSLALEQRVGGDRGAHAHLAQGSALLRQNAADALQRGVGIVSRIFRQQLFDPHPAVRCRGDDIGEGSSSVDREVPGQGHDPIEAERRDSLNKVIARKKLSGPGTSIRVRRFYCVIQRWIMESRQLRLPGLTLCGP